MRLTDEVEAPRRGCAKGSGRGVLDRPSERDEKRLRGVSAISTRRQGGVEERTM